MDFYLNALVKYCQYQERCHSEAKEKLASLGVYGDDAAEIIAQLIEANHLNETRFAQAYSRGKFRMLKWGRVKIRQELLQKGVSAYNIAKGMAEIDENDYENVLEQLMDRKIAELKKEKSKLVKKKKVYNYLLQKGYESGLIITMMDSKLN